MRYPYHMRTRAAFPALKLKRDGYMDHSTESQTDRKELKKTMSPAEVWALAAGAIIGWGCFVLPGTRFLPDAGPLGTCLAFLIGGGLLCTVALCYSILIKVYPVAGGFLHLRLRRLRDTGRFHLRLGAGSRLPLRHRRQRHGPRAAQPLRPARRFLMWAICIRSPDGTSTRANWP